MIEHLSALYFVIDALATYRLARLLTADELTKGIRRALGAVDKRGHINRPRTFYFVTCPWCTSIWIAAGVVAVTWAWPGGWIYPAAALAFSAVAGFLSGVV